MIRTAFSLGALAIVVVVGALIFTMTRGAEKPGEGEQALALPEVGVPPRTTPPLPNGPNGRELPSPEALPPLDPQGQAGLLPPSTQPGLGSDPLALPPLGGPGMTAAEPVPSPAPMPAPVAEPLDPTPADTGANRSYMVQNGDSLWRICVRNYGSAKHLKAIAQANNLSDSATIRPGQVLVLPALSGLREAPRDADHEAHQATAPVIPNTEDDLEAERHAPQPASRTDFQPMPPTL